MIGGLKLILPNPIKRKTSPRIFRALIVSMCCQRRAFAVLGISFCGQKVFVRFFGISGIRF
jgi:hypothetical protein